MSLYVSDASNGRIKEHLISDLSYVDQIGTLGSGDNQFNFASQVVSDGTHFYVADTNNHRIKKHLCSDLSYVSQIGSQGSGDDQFDFPRGITTDGTHLYIVDGNNHRIKKHLCSDLSYVSKFGSSGTGDNQFSSPKYITTDGTYLYITETGTIDRLRKNLCSDLSFVAKLGSFGSGDDQFNDPYGITTDGTYLYVCDRDNNRIKKHLCSDLTYNSQVATAFGLVFGITTDGTHIYFVSGTQHKMWKYLASDLSYVSQTGSQGSGDDQFSGPRDVGSDEWFTLMFQKELIESSLNQQYALAGVALHESELNQLYVLTGVSLINQTLDQLHALEAVTLIEQTLDQIYVLTGVTLIEQALDSMYSLISIKHEMELGQVYNLQGVPVASLDLVDVYYQLYIGTELVPFSSLRGTKRNAGQDSIYLVIPNGRAWIDAVTAQAGQDLIVKRGGRLRSDLSDVAPAEFIRATFETSAYDEGSRSSSITLMGFRDIEAPGTPKGVEMKDISYLAIGMDGKRRARGRMDDTLVYGDQVTLHDGTFFTVGEIGYTIAQGRFQMEVKEQ